MKPLRSLFRRWLGRFRQDRFEADMAEQMRTHLEFDAERNLAAGMTPEEAALAAQRTFGHRDSFAETCRDQREGFAGRQISLVAQDLRYGCRMLAKSPGFTVVAVLTLALGFGANAALFSWLSATQLRPVRVPDPENVVQMVPVNRFGVNMTAIFSYPEYAAFRDRSTELSAVVAASYPAARDFQGRVDGQEWLADAAKVQLVSGNYFEVLRVPFAAGRGFLPDEDVVPGRNPVVVLSHRFWQQRLGGDPAWIGRSVSLGGQAFTVVGVAAEFPRVRFGQDGDADVWVPLMMQRAILGEPTRRATAAAVAGSPAPTPLTVAMERANGQDRLASYSRQWLQLNGRLRPGSSPERATADLERVLAELDRADPEAALVRGREGGNWGHVGVLPATLMDPRGAASSDTLLMFLGPLMLLLIACANVGNLVLARNSVRAHELAIRRSLGANRWRLMRQLLTESLMLGLGGGIAGLILNLWLSRALIALFYGSEAIAIIDPSTDHRVILFTLALSLLTPVFFGLMPALRSTEGRLLEALKVGGMAGRGGTGARGQRPFIFCQMTLLVILLIGVGLPARIILRSTSRPGDGLGRIAVIEPDLTTHGYPPGQVDAQVQQLQARIASQPGVTAVGLVEGEGWYKGGPVLMSVEQGGNRPALEEVEVRSAAVAPAFFEAMQMRFLLGRPLVADDHGTHAVVVRADIARRLWEDENPLGKHLRGADRAVSYEVVGVFAPALNPELFASQAHVYEGLPETAAATGRERSLVVRLEGDAETVVPVLLREARALDPALQPRIQLASQLAEARAAEATPLIVLGSGLGLTALGLAAIGIYGVMSFAVGRRTAEIGLRMALGATPRNVIGLILRQGLQLVGTGVVCGVIISAGLVLVLRSQFVGVDLIDPLFFGGVLLLLGGVAALACWQPARRAAKVDPLVAMRTE